MLYGCEVGQLKEALTNAANAAILKCVTKKAGNRSKPFTFTTGSHGNDLDVEINVLYRRAMSIRRMIAKDEQVEIKAAKIIRNYSKAEYPGAKQPNIDVAALEPVPSHQRRYHRPPFSPRGPVGMLLLALFKVGACLDHSLIIRMPNEAPIDIVNTPIQQLQATIWQMGRSSRIKESAGTRNEHVGIYEIDMMATCSLDNQLDKSQAILLKVCQSVGAWDLDALAHLGNGHTNQCPDCNTNVKCDTRHLICHCPHFDKERYEGDEGLRKIPLEALPHPIINGIAPAMTADFEATFWGQRMPTTLDKQAEAEIGINRHINIVKATTQALLASYKSQLTDIWQSDLIKRTAGKLNARQFFQHLMTTRYSMDKEHHDTEEHNDSAPDEPNVFADGSYKNPKARYYGLLGYGVYWAHRCEESAPVEQHERDIMDGSEHHKDGCIIFGHLKGLRGSSTRAELASIILALAKYGPMHIGCDNLNAVKGLKCIIQHIHNMRSRKVQGKRTNAKPFRTSFSLTTDGDLWNDIHQRMLAKQSGAVAITWVGAHATQEHIREGITTIQNKVGNDAADTAADKGVGSHGDATVEISYLLAARQAKYNKFMQRIQRMVIRVRTAEKEARPKKETDANPFGNKPSVHVALPFANLHKHVPQTPWHRIKMANLSIIDKTIKVMLQPTTIEQIWVFLNNITLQSTEATDSGITWLELLMLANFRRV